MPSLATLKLIGGSAVLVAILMLFAAYKGEQRQSAKLQRQLIASVEGRKADRATYEQAQRDAKAKNEAHVQYIEQRQEAINADVSKDYAGDLARLRDQLGRVRKAPSAVGSPTSRAQASTVPAPARGVNGPDQLPLPPAELLRAQEIELQLKYLQEWVAAQGTVSR